MRGNDLVIWYLKKGIEFDQPIPMEFPGQATRNRFNYWTVPKRIPKRKTAFFLESQVEMDRNVLANGFIGVIA